MFIGGNFVLLFSISRIILSNGRHSSPCPKVNAGVGISGGRRGTLAGARRRLIPLERRDFSGRADSLSTGLYRVIPSSARKNLRFGRSLPVEWLMSRY